MISKTVELLLHKALRHEPTLLNLEIDKSGWVDTDIVINNINKLGLFINKSILFEYANTKMKYVFSCDKKRIRATYGHSLGIKITDLFSINNRPKKYLFHGTCSENVSSIKMQGIKKMDRDHVFLTSDIELASRYGCLKGKTASILIVDALNYYLDGKEICLAHDGIWIANEISPKYILSHENSF